MLKILFIFFGASLALFSFNPNNYIDRIPIGYPTLQVDVSPSESRLISTTENYCFSVFDLKNDTLITQIPFQEQQSSVYYSAAFINDNELILSEFGKIYYYNFIQKEKQIITNKHNFTLPFFDIGFNSNRKKIAFLTDNQKYPNKNIQLYDLDQKANLTSVEFDLSKITEPEDDINDVKFINNDQQLIIITLKGYIIIYDLISQNPIKTINGKKLLNIEYGRGENPNNLENFSDSTVFCYLLGYSAIYDFKNGNFINSPLLEYPWGMQHLSKNKRFLFCRDDLFGYLIIYDIQNNQITKIIYDQYMVPGRTKNALYYLESSNQIVVSFNGRLARYDLTTDQVIDYYGIICNKLLFTDDNKSLLFYDSDINGTYDLQTKTFKKKKGIINEYLPNGLKYITLTYDQSLNNSQIKIWETINDKLLKTINLNSYINNQIQISRDSKLLGIAGDNFINIYNLNNYEMIDSIYIPYLSSNYPFIFSVGGDTLCINIEVNNRVYKTQYYNLKNHSILCVEDGLDQLLINSETHFTLDGSLINNTNILGYAVGFHYPCIANDNYFFSSNYPAYYNISHDFKYIYGKLDKYNGNGDEWDFFILNSSNSSDIKIFNSIFSNPDLFLLSNDNRYLVVSRPEEGYYYIYDFKQMLTGIDEDNTINSFIYPNPASPGSIIKLQTEFIPQSIKLYDLLGNELASFNNTNELEIPENLNKGMYFLKYELGSKVMFDKLVVE